MSKAETELESTKKNATLDQPQKLWYLEALRGLAALQVALSHWKSAINKPNLGVFWDNSKPSLDHFLSSFFAGQLAVIQSN